MASLLKTYLRELPEPAIPFADYEAMIACAKEARFLVDAGESCEQVYEKIHERLRRFPPAHYHLLRSVALFLITLPVLRSFSRRFSLVSDDGERQTPLTHQKEERRR